MADGTSMADIAVDPNSAPALKSPADILRSAFESAVGERPFDLKLPGYGEPESELHVTFHTLSDYKDVRQRIRHAVNRPGADDSTKEVLIGLETLSAAAESSYALINGERHEIGCKLGLELYEYLFPNDQSPGAPANDSQAIMVLYHRHSTRVMGAYSRVDRWILTGERNDDAPDQDQTQIDPVEVVLGE